MRDLRATLTGLETAVARIEAMLTATLPHLATKAEMAQLAAQLPQLATKAEVAELGADLADKPSKEYLWLVVGVLVTAILGSFGAGLAAVAILH